MSMYKIDLGGVHMAYSPDRAELTFGRGRQWQWRGTARIVLSGGETLFFRDAACEACEEDTGVSTGVRAIYSGFRSADKALAFSVDTFVGIDFDGVLRFELAVTGDEPGQIARLYWPDSVAYDLPSGAGYTVIPQMQGLMIPSRWPEPVNDFGLHICTRQLYMPFFGQTDGQSGYFSLVDTPDDACLSIGHVPGGKTEPELFWICSLGHIQNRRVLITLYDSCSYVTFCKRYREYAIRKGLFVTLKEKSLRCPGINYLYGCPIVTEGIAVHISEKSSYYNRENPSRNDYYTTFSSHAERLAKLASHGLRKVYLHLDGWGKHGYDNLHPSPFPPHEAAGGVEGMKSLSNAVRALGYKFGIHDQYRDYFYDGPDYSPSRAVQNLDGTHPYDSTWYGGEQSMLCAVLAKDYVRRNYDEFERLGIKIDGSYLDVFSVAEHDECFNPRHPMTRADCAKYRAEALNELSARGIITSSEEVVDNMLPAIALCHHAPFAKTNLDDSSAPACGITLPLFSLVYHECVVIPWSNAEGGTWGIPPTQIGFLWALLTGGTIYVSPEADSRAIERTKLVCALQARTADCELVNHELIDGDPDRRRSVFSDGTTVEVNFADGSYKISPEPTTI